MSKKRTAGEPFELTYPTDKLKAGFRKMFNRLKAWAMRPMTQSEYDTAMARSGLYKRSCPCCGHRRTV